MSFNFIIFNFKYGKLAAIGRCPTAYLFGNTEHARAQKCRIDTAPTERCFRYALVVGITLNVTLEVPQSRQHLVRIRVLKGRGG